MWRYFWGVNRAGRFHCNDVFRSSPQSVWRDDHNEGGSRKRLLGCERFVKQDGNGQSGWYGHNQDRRNSFYKHKLHCNFQSFAEAFLLSSTCVLSWQYTQLWRIDNEAQRRKNLYYLDELLRRKQYELGFRVLTEQNRQSPSYGLTPLQNDSTKTTTPASPLQNEYFDKIQFQELLESYTTSSHGLASVISQEKVKEEKRRVRFESIGDGISTINALTDGITISASDNAHSSSEENVKESHHEALYAEFEENWKDLCDRYVKMKHNRRGVLAANSGNNATAVSHFETAGTAGCARAHFNLGLMYQTGNGCVQNLAQAMACYKEAVKYGSSEAAHNLALMYLSRGHEGDHLLALELLQTSVASGFTASKTELGVAYVEEGNLNEAYTLFEEAANEEDLDALYFLGLCHENGYGVEKNECKAAALYDEASKRGHAQAQCDLGHFFEHGIGGLPVNMESAKALYEKSSESGNFQAEERLKRLQTKSMLPENDNLRIKDISSLKLRSCASAPTLLSRLQTTLLTISLADWEVHHEEEIQSHTVPKLTKSATEGTLKDKCGDCEDNRGERVNTQFSGGGGWVNSQTENTDEDNKPSDIKTAANSVTEEDKCDIDLNFTVDIENNTIETRTNSAKKPYVLFTLGDNAYDIDDSEDSEVSWCDNSDHSSMGVTLDGRFGTVVDLSKVKAKRSPIKKSRSSSKKKKSAYDLLLLDGGFGSAKNLSKTKTVVKKDNKKKYSKHSLVTSGSESDFCITFDDNCVNPGLFSLAGNVSENAVRLP